MNTTSPFDQLPSRVRYYMLDWKDNNFEHFRAIHGAVSLRTLTHAQIHALFYQATKNDSDNMAVNALKQTT